MNPGFLAYTMRGEDRNEEDKYHKQHWCTKIILNQGRLEEIMEATINIADETMEMIFMERTPHLVVIKVLKGDLQGWMQEDKVWLQEVAKRSVLEWDGIYSAIQDKTSVSMILTSEE